MISIGNFFFRYRNFLFLFLYLALFIPSAPLFSPAYFGPYYYIWPITIGLIITVSGQLIRGATIGLAYIIRGGKEGKVYAEELVTGGIFNHCRNPLYVGNILMLCGVGVLSNSLLYVLIFIPFFNVDVVTLGIRNIKKCYENVLTNLKLALQQLLTTCPMRPQKVSIHILISPLQLTHLKIE
jgi:protein-S-isoprenylcysteine O-methyltransferase Ste14